MKSKTRKSSRVAKLFEGNDTYGVPVEVALCEHGLWYFRVYRWNGYGKSFSKWAPHRDPHDESGRPFWGWNRLREVPDAPKLRLRLPLP